MKKMGIIIIVCILVCIAGGSFLAIHLIRNVEVSETSISNVRPVNYEKTEAFTSVQLDLTSMDVKIEKSSENAISYRLQDAKKQKLEYLEKICCTDPSSIRELTPFIEKIQLI